MKKVLTRRLNLLYFLTITPLILFGMYKNGIALYAKNYSSLIESLKPFILVFMSMSGAFIGSFINERKKSKKIDFSYITKCKRQLLESILFACILPIKSSPVIVFFLSFLTYLFIKKDKINKPAFMYIIISIINRVLSLNIFLNAYQINNTLVYDNMDLFFGLGAGGICSTSILGISMALLILSFNELYKRDISYSALITYAIIVLTYKMYLGAYTEIFTMLFSYNTIFTFVFIAPLISSSAYTTKGQVLSGILIAIITFGLTFVTPYSSSMIAIFVVSLMSNILDRIYIIK